jgi:antitoxin component YwqK of YwqJK toxin-antitoxin module/Tfp pilus assembly protein PilF
MKFVLIVSVLTLNSYFSFSQQNGPLHSGDIIDKGIQLYDSGQFKKALELYNLIDRNDTNYLKSLYERSITCQADSQYVLAKAYCEEGLAYKEDNEYMAELYNTYGNILNITGEVDKSVQVFDEAIKKYPSFSLLYFNKGLALHSMQHYAEAEELFKQALLINPYQYSAHYYLGVTALAQGKIIPAFLSLLAYLSLYPEGKYSTKCIDLIDAISKTKDEILEYKSKATGEADENFEAVESIVLSKVALDKGYKLRAQVDDPIIRQIQVVFEKLEYKRTDPDFWMQFYVPFYKKIYEEGHFESFINWSFENVNVQSIKDYNKKNKKAIEIFTEEIVNYYNLIRSTRELTFDKRELITNRYFYTEGKLIAKGVLTDDGKNNGSWVFFYPPGNIKASGNYNLLGAREGEWLYYYYSGKLKGREIYQNGKLEGEQISYRESGIETSRETFKNDLSNGQKTVYYPSGQLYSIGSANMSKDEGEYKEYYSNGNIRQIKHYIHSILSGDYALYYEDGQLKETGHYQNDQPDGLIKDYFENGSVSAEGTLDKGIATGVWNYYYDNGQLKNKAQFTNNKMDGVFEEYYDNGRLKSTGLYKNGLANGETLIYDKDGIIYARYIFENDIPKSVRFFDKSGKQISFSERKGNEFQMKIFKPQGLLYSQRELDSKGKIEGMETDYYPSGKINVTSMYTGGELNGPLIYYYRNGRKQSETAMQGGIKEGQYTGYYSHGQIQSEGWYANDQAEGSWNYYDEMGKISNRSYYLRDEIYGYKEEYSPNGHKTFEYKYQNGWIAELKQFDSSGKILIHDTFPEGTGKYLLVYPNGNKMEEGAYQKGFFTGPVIKYFFDGSIASIQYYVKGQLDSIYVSYFYKGIKKTEGRFRLGKKTGTWKIYNENGILNYTENYLEDHLNGPRTYFYPNGNIEYEFNYKNDERNGIVKRLEGDGTLAYWVRYDEGDPVAYSYSDKTGKILSEIPILHDSVHLKTFYPNGNVSRECIFVDGQLNGVDRLYYGNGQLYSIDSSEYNVTEGIALKYFANGNLKSAYNYFHDNPHGLCKEYYENGVIEKEINFWNGEAHGTTKYFNQVGKLTETRNYYYGTLLSVNYAN